MSKTENFVANGQRICIVCGATYDSGEILVHKRLREIKEDQRVTGFGLCKEHKELYDQGYVALVEVDPSKSTIENGRIAPSNAYRTGNVCHMKRDACFRVFGKDVDTPAMFVEVGVIDELRKLQEAA